MHSQCISRVSLLAFKSLYKHMWTDWTLRIIFLYGHIWTDKAPREKKTASLKMKIKFSCSVVLFCSLGFLYLALKSQNAAEELNKEKSCTSVLCLSTMQSRSRGNNLMAGGGDTKTVSLGGVLLPICQ